MRFVMFTTAKDNGGTPVAINPCTVLAVIASPGSGLTDRNPNESAILLSGMDGVIEVVGSVAEVVAALEAAGAPAVAPVVEVAPTDLEMAALLLQVVASEIDDQELDHLAEHVNSEIGTRYDTDRHDGAISRLHNLAARLRGAR